MSILPTKLWLFTMVQTRSSKIPSSLGTMLTANITVTTIKYSSSSTIILVQPATKSSSSSIITPVETVSGDANIINTYCGTTKKSVDVPTDQNKKSAGNTDNNDTIQMMLPMTMMITFQLNQPHLTLLFPEQKYQEAPVRVVRTLL